MVKKGRVLWRFEASIGTDVCFCCLHGVIPSNSFTWGSSSRLAVRMTSADAHRPSVEQCLADCFFNTMGEVKRGKVRGDRQG